MQPPLLHLLTDLSPQLIIHLLMVPKYKRVRVNQQYKVKYRIIFCNKFLVNSLRLGIREEHPASNTLRRDSKIMIHESSHL